MECSGKRSFVFLHHALSSQSQMKDILASRLLSLYSKRIGLLNWFVIKLYLYRDMLLTCFTDIHIRTHAHDRMNYFLNKHSRWWYEVEKGERKLSKRPILKVTM